MEYKDYYKILGVDKNADEKTIKSAYRKLVKKYHPDKTKGDVKLEKKFKEIAEAYEVLSNPEKRKRYDELGANWDRFGSADSWQRAHTNFYGFSKGGNTGSYKFYTNMDQNGTDFSDFFKAFFGDFDMGGRSSYGFTGGSMTFDGNDLESEIRLSVEEAYHGTTAQVNINGDIIKIKIPAGIKDGQKIRVAGKGEPGHNGGKPGDLYLKVHIKEHEYYKVDGSDIKVNVPITPSEAVLGAKIQIPTLKGKINITVPPGTSSGKVLRLKELGLGSGSKKGSLLVTLNIVIPPEPSDKEIELYRQLQEVSSYNPREKAW